MKIAICDDEQAYIEKISALITKTTQSKNLETEVFAYQDPEQFLDSDLCSFAIVFLDGNMGKISGITVAQQLRMVNPDVLIIYISAYLEFAVMGYKVQAFRYILKDNLETDFQSVFTDALQQLNVQTKQIQLRIKSNELCITTKDILYIESDKRRTIFNLCTNESPIVSYKKISELQSELADSGFARIQRSYLVNLSHIAKINGRSIVLDTGAKLFCSKELQKQVLTEYTLWRGK